MSFFRSTMRPLRRPLRPECPLMGLEKLTERMEALTIGSIYRIHQQIRDVARLMLL